MADEFSHKLRIQKKFRNLKTIQKLLENPAQLEEYLTGQSPILSDNVEPLPSNGFIHVDKDLHYMFESDPVLNSTRVTEIRSGDIRLSATIEDNFFYQHMFNFALVVILLLQVIVVWAFIWCRLSKFGNQPINNQHDDIFNAAEGGIALRNVRDREMLPEVIPQQHNQHDVPEPNQNDDDIVIEVNRCARYG